MSLSSLLQLNQNLLTTSLATLLVLPRMVHCFKPSAHNLILTNLDLTIFDKFDNERNIRGNLIIEFHCGRVPNEPQRNPIYDSPLKLFNVYGRPVIGRAEVLRAA